jgi:CRISPR-associated exonuclease Cas4
MLLPMDSVCLAITPQLSPCSRIQLRIVWGEKTACCLTALAVFSWTCKSYGESVMDTLPLAISALQHFAYCPRQFGLIHLEQAWSDNHFTAQGNVLHERVDSQEAETRGSKRSERSVEVHSERLGLHGKLDLLEIYSESQGAVGCSKCYVPVEYKRGKRKVMDWDRIQLCAQAMCLEEMRGITIEEGALWYWQERLREVVALDDALRAQTLNCIEGARAVLLSQATPSPTPNPKRCKACSLFDLCAPDVVRKDRSTEYAQTLFEILPVDCSEWAKPKGDKA